jgi:hypothetical protein
MRRAMTDLSQTENTCLALLRIKTIENAFSCDFEHVELDCCAERATTHISEVRLAIERCYNGVASDAVLVGRYLSEVKDRIYGNFREWALKKLNLTKDQTSDFMRIARLSKELKDPKGKSMRELLRQCDALEGKTRKKSPPNFENDMRRLLAKYTPEQILDYLAALDVAQCSTFEPELQLVA